MFWINPISEIESDIVLGMKSTTNSQPTIHFQGSVTKNKGQVLCNKQSTARINDNAQSHDQREEKKLNSTIIISNGAHALKADKIIKNQ